MTVREEILEIVRTLPGLTANEVGELIPRAGQSQISGLLSVMAAEGIVSRKAKPRPDYQGFGRRTVFTHSINPNPAPIARPRKLRVPTDVGMAARLAEAQAEIAEMRTWKAEAVARFPDLAVDPILLDARRLVAAKLNGSDRQLASDILAGRKDNILPVQVAIEALGRGVIEASSR